MKKKIIFTTLILLIVVLAVSYLQFGRDTVINNSITSQSPGGYEMTLTVTANKLVLTNQETFAATFVSRVIANDFQNLMFSYDQLGYPNKLKVTVYTNEHARRLGTPAFSFRYETEDPDSYNIKDHPEKFQIILDTK